MRRSKRARAKLKRKRRLEKRQREEALRVLTDEPDLSRARWRARPSMKPYPEHLRADDEE